MIGSTDSACLSTVFLQRHTLVIVSITGSIAVPFPITQREHTCNIQPFYRSNLHIQFHTFMQGIYTSHIHIVFSTFLIIQLTRFSHRLIQPFGPVSIDISSQPAVAETITQFERKHFFILSILVDGMTCIRLHESTIREFRRTANITQVEENVMIFSNVVVSSTFCSKSEEANFIWFSMSFVVEQAVVTPISSIRQWTGNESRKFVFIEFALEESTFLHYMSVIITVNYITNTQLFIFPHRIGSCDIIFSQHITTSRVHEILTTVQVRNFIGMSSLVITEVYTTIEVDVLTELSGISRQQTIPVVIVLWQAHGKHRTIFTFRVDILDSSIVECTIRITELSLKHTIVGTFPILIRISVIFVTLSGITITTSDRNISNSTQRRFVINLPLMIQADLRFVVRVVLTGSATTFVVKTVSWIIFIILNAIHFFSHFPVSNCQSAITLIVCLRSTKYCKRQLMSVIQSFWDIQEVVVAFKVKSLSISVTPVLRTQQSHSPSWFSKTCRNTEQDFVHTIVTQRIRYCTTFLAFQTLSNDIDSTSHRRSRNFWST